MVAPGRGSHVAFAVFDAGQALSMSVMTGAAQRATHTPDPSKLSSGLCWIAPDMATTGKNRSQIFKLNPKL